MKTNPYNFLLILLLALSVMTACKDNKGDTEPSKREMLAAQEWQGKALLANGINVTDQPLLGTLPDVRTLTLNFETDGTYTATYMDEGKMISQNGKWEFRENETILYLDLSFLEAYKLFIKELTSERLNLTSTTVYSGFNVPVEVQFVAK